MTERYILTKDIDAYPLTADGKLTPVVRMVVLTELVMPPKPLPDDYAHGPGLSKFLYRGAFYVANTKVLQEALPGWKR